MGPPPAGAQAESIRSAANADDVYDVVAAMEALDTMRKQTLQNQWSRRCRPGFGPGNR